MENKFKAGEVVFDRTRPNQRLIVQHFDADIYYCKVPYDKSRREFIYYEGELSAEHSHVDRFIY